MFVTPDERRFDQDGDAYADCGISTRREGKEDWRFFDVSPRYPFSRDEL